MKIRRFLVRGVVVLAGGWRGFDRGDRGPQGEIVPRHMVLAIPVILKSGKSKIKRLHIASFLCPDEWLLIAWINGMKNLTLYQLYILHDIKI